MSSLPSGKGDIARKIRSRIDRAQTLPSEGYFVLCLHPKSFADDGVPYHIQSTRGCFRTYTEAQAYKGTINPDWEPVIFSVPAFVRLGKEWYPKAWPPHSYEANVNAFNAERSSSE